jgi:hypothetical protein
MRSREPDSRPCQSSSEDGAADRGKQRCVVSVHDIVWAGVDTVQCTTPGVRAVCLAPPRHMLLCTTTAAAAAVTATTAAPASGTLGRGSAQSGHSCPC